MPAPRAISFAAGTIRSIFRRYEWLSHSIAPKAEAPEYWRLTVGENTCAKPYSTAMLNISAMSFGSLSAKAIEALNAGAAVGDFAHNTGEGSISKYHRSHGGDLIWELGSGYFGARKSDGNFDPEQFRDRSSDDQVKMIELKLSQGAKPGHGGVLPAAKVTPEIAEARGVPVGVTVTSPAAHPAFSSPIEKLEFVAELRELSGGKPVGTKCAVSRRLSPWARPCRYRPAPRFHHRRRRGGRDGAAPLGCRFRGMPLRKGKSWSATCWSA